MCRYLIKRDGAGGWNPVVCQLNSGKLSRFCVNCSVTKQRTALNIKNQIISDFNFTTIVLQMTIFVHFQDPKFLLILNFLSILTIFFHDRIWPDSRILQQPKYFVMTNTIQMGSVSLHVCQSVICMILTYCYSTKILELMLLSVC